MAPGDIPIIDCHTHIGRLPGVLNDDFGAEDLCYIAEHEDVAFMLASSASATTVSAPHGMDEAVAMVERHGALLGGMFWISPHDRSWAKDVDRAVAHRFYGIKIHPVLDHYVVNHAALDEVFVCARQHGWPILTHTGEDGTPASALCYEPLIRAYPDVVLILAHLRLEAIPLAKRYANVYVDTTHVPPPLVEVGLDVLGPAKILFGTDAPAGFDVGRPVVRERPRRSYDSIIQGLRARDIADATLERILYQNAREIFGLPG